MSANSDAAKAAMLRLLKARAMMLKFQKTLGSFIPANELADLVVQAETETGTVGDPDVDSILNDIIHGQI
jgi:hypothetical protein